MTDYLFAIPGNLAALTGGYAYARRVLAELPWLRHLPLPGGFPAPSAAELAKTAAIFAALPGDSVLLIDGLALGACDAATLSAIPGRFVALVHHPLCLESGILPVRAAELRASERDALAAATSVIATSRHTAELLAREFAVPAEKLQIVEPGTDPAPRAPCSGSPPCLLAVGAITPRKGFTLLVQALAGLKELDWRLTIAGDTGRDAAEAARLRDAIDAAGLQRRISLPGAVSDAELAALHAGANLFVISSLYEGYGMAAAEALARGLPIISTTGGALAETVPDGAGLKLPPGDSAALATALRALLHSPAARRAAADAAWRHAGTQPRWEESSAKLGRILRRARPIRPSAATPHPAG